MIDRTPWFWVLFGWTVFVWLSRLRNILSNEDLSTNGRIVRVAVVVVFVSLAAAAAVAVRKKRPAVLVLFLAWTVGYWLVRGTGILIDGDYSVRFKLVHTVLMVVSITLSALTARQMRLRR